MECHCCKREGVATQCVGGDPVTLCLCLQCADAFGIGYEVGRVSGMEWNASRVLEAAADGKARLARIGALNESNRKTLRKEV